MARTTEQLQKHLLYWTKGEPSAVAIKVARLLDLWQGLHHLDDSQMRKVDWTNSRYIVLKLDRYSCPGGGLSTWDFDDLTRLVFLAHDLCIRADILPSSNRYLELTFHPRDGREGGTSARHPSLEQAVAKWRERCPAEEEAAMAAS